LGNNSNYLDIGPYPLYPFGFGLSYTTFEYRNAELSATRLGKGENLTMRVTVTNKGKFAADEVAQLYIRNTTGGSTNPVRELKDFQRVRFEPGATKIISFTLSA